MAVSIELLLLLLLFPRRCKRARLKIVQNEKHCSCILPQVLGMPRVNPNTPQQLNLCFARDAPAILMSTNVPRINFGNNSRRHKYFYPQNQRESKDIIKAKLFPDVGQPATTSRTNVPALAHCTACTARQKTNSSSHSSASI